MPKQSNRNDPKTAGLVREGTLNPSPEEVGDPNARVSALLTDGETSAMCRRRRRSSGGWRDGTRELDTERGTCAARGADLDTPAVRFHQMLDDVEPEAHASIRGIERGIT
jgi:hypothetical protein